uniref:Replication protein n=1 Tax=Dulem virus 61 TaxID=3145772 RepID=A0AAU8B8I4_9VIRU
MILPRLYTTPALGVADRWAARGTAGGRAQGGALGASEFFPPALTGGESPRRIELRIRRPETAAASVGQRARVDWMTATFQCFSDCAHEREILDLLRKLVGRNVTAETCPGMLGYTNGIRYFVGDGVQVARFDWGGNHHKGRGRLDVNGAGASAINDWQPVCDFVSEQFDYKLTRVDLAVDMIDGQYTVEHCLDWYEAGDFNAGGRNPRHSLVGDWLSPRHGRTFEVGRRVNGKMLRAYEKGRQLGDSDSAWTRFEVEFRNIDRDLPLSMLIDTDKYFAGAYRCLQRLIDAEPETISTHQAEGEINIAHLSKYCATAYGRLLSVLRLHFSDEDVLNALTVNGVPRRLERVSVAGFIESLSSLKMRGT